MMLYHIVEAWKRNRRGIAFGLGFVITAIAFLVAKLLFSRTPHLIGITTIFFTVLLTMPILTHILREEETIEKKHKSFFKKNKAVIDFYLYFFLGTFLLFFIASSVNSHLVFSKEDFYNIQPSNLDVNLPPPTPDNFNLMQDIIANNLYVLFIAFALSLLFGAGSIFLIILNSSIAAAAITQHISQTTGYSALGVLCNTSVFSIHFIPEMLAYLVAAIAGGLIAVDLVREKFMSRSFDEIIVESVKLLGVAIILLIIGGFLETYVSGQMFLRNVCTVSPERVFEIIQIIVFLAIAVSLGFFLERIRKRH